MVDAYWLLFANCNNDGMLFYLLLLLTIVPISELILLLEVHRALAAHFGTGVGLLVTIGSIGVTGILGAILARYQGIGVIRRLSEHMQRGENPGPSIADGVLVLIGAALLLTPGIMTDLFGFSLLLPITRIVYRNALLRWVTKRIERGTIQVHINHRGATTFDQDDVIDIEPGQQRPQPRNEIKG